MSESGAGELNPDLPSASVRSSLFRKYFIAIFIALTIPLLTISTIDAWFGYRDQRTVLDALLRAQAASAASRIAQFLHDTRDQLRGTARQPSATGSDQEPYLDVLRLLRRVPAMWSVTLVDGTDKERLFVSRIDLNRTASGKDYAKHPAIVSTRLEESWFSPMEYSGNAEPRMSIAVGADRKDVYTAIAEINLKLIRDVIAEIRVGNTGYAFVLDQTGQLVAHPDISKVLLGTHSRAAMRKFQEAFRWSEGSTITTTDPDGVPVLAIMAAPLEGVGWSVFAVQPTAEAFAPIYLALWRTGGLLLVAAAIAGLLAYLLARRIAGPIRLLEEGAERIGAGQFDHPVSVSTGDELERLASRFNRMAGELKVSQERSERIARLKRFLAPQIAELVEKTGDETALAGQRAEIVAAFCDLRGFTAFTARAEPEEIMQVLAEYYRALGSVITRYQATLTNFSADGLMVLVNAPVPCPDPALHALKMAVDMQTAVQQIIGGWRQRGFEIGFGIGLAMGWATVGRIGYEGRVDYTAIGNVVNLAARLCSAAEDRQILVDQALARAVGDRFPVVALGTRQLKGYDRPVQAYGLALPNKTSDELPAEKSDASNS